MHGLVIRFWVASAMPLLALASAGCPGEAKRPLGASCSLDGDCGVGECIAQICLDPDADEDRDGLVNRLEAAIGSDPLQADSDGDGIDDGREVGLDLANPADTDADGKPDALESRHADADGDCISDQLDPDDAAVESDPAALARYLCLNVGACASFGAVTASCAGGAPTCDYSQVPGFEMPELSCDRIDNDCDGQTDERHAPGGEVTFDGGPYPADAGKALGASCGVGACAGGTVVCAADTRTLACSTGGRAGPLACNADMDCDGAGDESQVSNPITDPLAGCREFFADADHDGFGAGAGRCLCAPFGAYLVDNRSDCAETDALRYPMAAGICGLDADCDTRLEDVGEACDDGNADVADGCHACRAVARRIDARGRYAGAVASAGLENGGFVVAWDAGSDPLGEVRLGRTIAFFDPTGKEVRRLDGLGLDEGAYAARTDLAALPDGNVAVGHWRSDPASGGWRYQVQRFDPDGATAGMPAEVYSGQQLDRVVLAPAADDGIAFVALAPGAQGTRRILIKSIDHDGNTSTREGGRDVDASAGGFDALGSDDGSVVATWTRYEPESLVETRVTQRFDAGGRPVGEPRAFVPDGLELRSVRLARRDRGWALFFIGTRATTGFTQAVGYQAFEADGPVGGLVYLQQDDGDGCPYDLSAGFDDAGYAWAVVADGECRSALRGWHAGATTVPLSPLDPRLHPNADVYEVAGSASGAGFLLAFPVGGDTPLGGIYLQRYGAAATPVYLPSP